MPPQITISKFLTFFLLAIALLLVNHHDVMALDPVTQQDIRDAVLERKQFTSEQLNAMDLNGDGVVSVADLVNLIKAGDSNAHIASFEKGATQITESDGVANIKVNFETPFSGELKYTLSGTAAAGDDFDPISGTITVNGAFVEIPITIIDDAVLEESADTIVLDLFYADDQSLGYVLGLQTTHTIYILDNDAIWQGSIENNGAALHFQMKIIQSPAGAVGALVSDGYGIIPTNPTKDPDNEWPALSINLSENSFNATFDEITIPVDATLANVAMTCEFVFEANSGQSGHTLKPESEIRGKLTEFIHCPTHKQFEREITGTFSLLKPPSVIESQRPVLEDI